MTASKQLYETGYMDEKDILQDLKAKTIFLAEYAATLEAVGAQSSRIQYNTVRIAKSWGLWCNLLMLPQTINVTLHDEGREHSYTYVKKTPSLPLNFKINMKLSHLSWSAFDKKLPLDTLWEEFHKIGSEPRENAWTVLILVAFANACFCRLFDGNYTSMVIVWLATFVGFFIKQQLLRRQINELAVFVICSFVSTVIGATDFLYFHGGTEDMSLATSMLYLVPGVPIINGVMDILDRHVLSGMARLINACMLIVCIAVGLTLTVVLFKVDPNNFTKVIRPDIISASIADGLFAAVAGTGFAIISNPPRKALAITAILACIGHAVRYFLMHEPMLMLDQVTASTCAGLAIGLLAVPAAMTIHYPAEGFAFPALLPMVPGMFAYKAVRDLINIVQLPGSYTMEYVAKFFHNSTLTILVMFGMVAGCVIPIFIFHKQSYQVTRREK
ncbi:Uncharacterized membrane protein YjjP, DUF1212 family [Prevotella sp. KH2C16]|nr:Uncharacterized membrane protein YjjP, DUF1212 family [Prevotella sp. KH2C16]